MFVIQPQNTTAFVGETVSFNCTTTNGVNEQSIIIWIINGTHYISYGQLPLNHKIDQTTQSLVIEGVDASINNTSYQCFLQTVGHSAIGVLHVKLPPGMQKCSLTSGQKNTIQY